MHDERGSSSCAARDISAVLTRCARAETPLAAGCCLSAHGVKKRLRTRLVEVIAKIDECLSLPGSDAYRPSIEHYRVGAYSSYGRPVDECMQVIDAYVAIQPSLAARAAAVLAACGERSELAPRYLDAMITELEAAASDDQVIENTLQHAYRVRQRVTGKPADQP